MKKPMLKSNSGNKVQNNKKAIWKIMIILFALVLGLLIYYVAKDEGKVEKDKQRFESVEAKLNVLVAAVEAKLGKPDAAESRNSCGRANLKSSQGPLTCSISHEYAYIVTNIEEADSLVSSAEEIIRTQSDVFSVSKPLSGSFHQWPREEGIREIDSDFVAIKERMNCGATYFFVPPNVFFGNLLSSDTTKFNLTVDIGCGDGAKAEHYPMRD